MAPIADRLIQAARDAQRRLRDRPFIIDVVFAVLVFIVEIVDLFASSEAADLHREPDVWAVLLIAFGAFCLAWRRDRPIESLMFVIATLAVFYLRDYGSFMSVVGLAGFYAVAAHAANRRRAWFGIVVAGLGLFSLASVTLLDRPAGFNYSGAISMSSYIGIAVLVGVVTRNRVQIFMKAEARAERAEAERAIAADKAAAQERLRIARELHDVVAHGMSVISVQAAAAQEIARTDPDRSIELMQLVETTSRESLSEMRRMLGILRTGQRSTEQAEEANRSPQPSLDDLAETIEHCRDAGLPTEFRVVGEARPLSAGLELAIFRIVQEALTNVLKHGGSAATATVELQYQDRAVQVRVSDSGRGVLLGTTTAFTGNGLLGMRERVDMYDGTLQAGAKPGGGYEVTARIPVGPGTDRPRVVSADAVPVGPTS